MSEIALKNKLNKLLIAGMNPRSKWFRDDVACIKAATNMKSPEELRDAISRWAAVSEVTRKEISFNYADF